MLNGFCFFSSGVVHGNEMTPQTEHEEDEKEPALRTEVENGGVLRDGATQIVAPAI